MEKINFLDLGKQPRANGYITKEETPVEYFYHLQYYFDPNTYLVGQVNHVEKESIYNDTYAYHSSTSETMKQHFKFIADSIPNGKVLEIGSNDGIFIKNLPKETTFAIEPCGNFAEMTNKMGYKTYPKFWNLQTADAILKNHGQMDVVFAANVMNHIADLDEVLEAVNIVLKKNGKFIFEDPSLLSMLTNGSYDLLYDEHVWSFSVTALHKLLRKHNLYLCDIHRSAVHGGSNIITASKEFYYRSSVEFHTQMEEHFGIGKPETYEMFSKRVEKSKDDLFEMLWKLKYSEEKTIVSYGATAKSSTVFNYCKIDPNLIEYIIDNTPEKQDMLSPGTHIPIISPEKAKEYDCDAIYLGAWNYAKEIRAKETDLKDKTWITHVPFVRAI